MWAVRTQKSSLGKVGWVDRLCLSSQHFRCEEEWMCCVAAGWWWDWSRRQVHIWAETICRGNFASPRGLWVIELWRFREGMTCCEQSWERFIDRHHFPPPQLLNMFVLYQCGNISCCTFTQVLFCRLYVVLSNSRYISFNLRTQIETDAAWCLCCLNCDSQQRLTRLQDVHCSAPTLFLSCLLLDVRHVTRVNLFNQKQVS